MNRLVRLVAICFVAGTAPGGIAHAGMDEANAALQSGDYTTAHAEAMPMAESGDPVAQWLIGTLYAEGWGVDRDNETATRWYAAAADAGLPAAQLAFGQRLAAGLGIDPDLESATDWLKAAAAKGETDADLTLGTIYASRHDLAANDPAGAMRLQHEIETGSARAEYSLGRCYDLGQCGVEQDEAQALALYRLSAAREHPAAQFQLGMSYMEGRGSPKDWKRGLEWIGQAARNDDIEAQRFLAEKLRTGDGDIPVNIRGANHWEQKLKNRAEADVEVASVELKSAADRPQPGEATSAPTASSRAEDAVETTDKSPDPGTTAASASEQVAASKPTTKQAPTVSAAIKKASAKKPPKKPELREASPISTAAVTAAPTQANSEESAESAAAPPLKDSGTSTLGEPQFALISWAPDPSVDGEALFKEASKLNVKGGSKADHKRARELFEKAATAGYAPAQSMLGHMLYYAIGGPRDVDRAAEWIRSAAEQGHPRGQFNYGLLLSGGKGVKQDRTKAMQWYRKSAEQGFGGAQINLAYFLAGLDRKAGAAGPDDMTEALVWATLAAEQRTPNSVRILKKLKSRASAKQRKEAEARVVDWQARQEN